MWGTEYWGQGYWGPEFWGPEGTVGDPPGQASNPVPVDTAIDVAQDAILSWDAGAFTTSHDVYFGVDPTPDITEFQGNQPGTTFDPPGLLSNLTQYWWRIDEVNELDTTTGPVWTFTTGNFAPQPASNPSPSNGATNRRITVDLFWTAGAGTETHDVYFGTVNPPGPGQFQGNQVPNTFDPGTLSINTTYYWRIDEVNAAGTTEGPVWSFTTTPSTAANLTNPPAGLQGLMAGWWDL